MDSNSLELELVVKTKDARDPKTLYRDVPGQFTDFGKIYRRGFGDNPSPTQVAEGMPKYGDYKQSGLTITEISDDWTYVLRSVSLLQTYLCNEIYCRRISYRAFRLSY